MAGNWKESHDWLKEALETHGDASPTAEAAAIYRTAYIQVIRVNYEAVLPLVEQALGVCVDAGDMERRGVAT